MKPLQPCFPRATQARNALSGSPYPSTAGYPLSLAEEGETVRIIMVRSGHHLMERLISMGLQIDDTVTVIRKQPGGATIIEKSGSRYALGGGMSHKINVIRM
jgi:ferrous iron transport protein A